MPDEERKADPADAGTADAAPPVDEAPPAEAPAEAPAEDAAPAGASQAPPHAAVEGPEEPLEPVREQAHEEPGLSERVASLEAREQELLDELARTKADRDAKERDLLERMQRLQADFDNFRRRTREEATAATARGKEALLKGILPALDGMDRALAHAEDEGLRLIARQLHGLLAQQGVVVLAPEAGQGFDAKMHEAVAQEAAEDAKSGTVLKVLEKGYVLDGKVLRPARVVVAA